MERRLAPLPAYAYAHLPDNSLIDFVAPFVGLTCVIALPKIGFSTPVNFATKADGKLQVPTHGS